MKKEKIYLIVTVILLILLLIQSIKYNYLSCYNNVTQEISAVIIENKDKFYNYNIEDFIDLLKNEYVSINSVVSEKNDFKAILTFNGNLYKLIEYVKDLEEKEIIVNSYEIKRNEFLECIMEVVT